MAKKKSKRLSPEEEMEAVNAIVNSKHNSVNFLRGVSIEVKCKTLNQKKFINLIKEKEIVIAAGFAGTGKTFLSCAEALKLLKADIGYNKIVVVKSVTTLKNEEIGFLKGTMKEKMEPFMFSFMTNFHKIVGKAISEQLETMGMLEVLPLAYVRGMNIDHAIVIVDEAQNIGMDNMKTIMTRLGTRSKMIIVGDTKQVDLGSKNESSLHHIMDKFKDIPEFGVMHFEKCDQVRNPLINVIEDVFDELEGNKSVS